MVYRHPRQVHRESLICARKVPKGCSNNYLGGTGLSCGNSEDGWDPFLAFEDTWSVPCSVRSFGSFEHLEETESSSEEDWETDLLIKGKNNFSATRLPVFAERRRQLGRGGPASHQSVTAQGRSLPRRPLKGWSPKKGETLPHASAAVPTLNSGPCHLPIPQENSPHQ